MGLFDTLPSVDCILSTTHSHASGLLHAWLFNAGTGTAVTDYVTASDGTLSGTYSWAEGGGVTFTGGKMTPASLSTDTGITIVCGLQRGSASGWQCVFGWTTLVGLNGATPTYYGLDAGTTYIDGEEGNSAPAGEEHQVAWMTADVHDGMSSNWVVGTDNWGEHLAGSTVAFLYVYDSTSVVEILGELATDPYAMFSEPATPTVVSGAHWFNGSPVLTALISKYQSRWTRGSPLSNGPDVETNTQFVTGAGGLSFGGTATQSYETSARLRVAQAAVEVLSHHDVVPARLAQLIVETLSYNISTRRVTQLVVETLTKSPQSLATTQLVVETLSSYRVTATISADGAIVFGGAADWARSVGFPPVIGSGTLTFSSGATTAFVYVQIYAWDGGGGLILGSTGAIRAGRIITGEGSYQFTGDADQTSNFGLVIEGGTDGLGSLYFSGGMEWEGFIRSGSAVGDGGLRFRGLASAQIVTYPPTGVYYLGCPGLPEGPFSTVCAEPSTSWSWCGPCMSPDGMFQDSEWKEDYLQYGITPGTHWRP